MRYLGAVLFLVFGLGTLVSGCGSSSCAGGSGPIVSQTIDLSSFTAVNFQAAGEVLVVPGSTQRVVVRGQQNIIDRLNRDVVNGVWDIGFTECVDNVSELRVDITLPELDGVELSGAGTVEAETQADTIDTTLSGAGTVTVSGSSRTQNALLEGSGTIEAFALSTEETSVVLAGQGNVSVSATDSLDVELSGAGSVFYKGEPDLNVHITGIGTVNDAN